LSQSPGAGRESAHHTWIAMTLICIIGVFSYVDRNLLAVALPQIKQEFQLSDWRLGLLGGSFGILYAFCGIPLGRLADSGGSRRTIIGAAAAFWSLMTAACGAASGYWTLFAARCGVAFGEAAFLPAAYSMISDLFSPAKRHLALSILSAACSIGVVGGLALGAHIAAVYGWRNAFYLLGIPGIAFALLSTLVIREPPRGTTDASAVERTVPPSLMAAVKNLLRNRVFMWIVPTAGFNGFLMLGIVQWMPSFFSRTHQLPLASIGLWFGVAFGVGMALGQLCGGAVCTRMAAKSIFEPLRLCMLTNLLMVPGFLLVLWIPNVPLAIAMTFITTFIGAFGHPAQSAGVQNAVGTRERGTAHGVLSMAVSMIGMGVGPLFVGVVSHAFETSLGDAQGLRVALSVSQVLFLMASYCGWRAYRAGVEHARMHGNNANGF
jgi:MFS family permease